MNNERLEAATKAAYETCYFQRNLSWETATAAVQNAWRGIIRAAVEAYDA